jgi:2-keto-4-pentenoate hydratase/2-oxohepta-3-ene-1,7-dioic acid hydratase in catechol pathway
VFTGTPDGVGPIAFGDVLEARIQDVGGLRVEIGSGA